MSIVAAVKKAIGWCGGDHWKLELAEPAQTAHYANIVHREVDAWNDYHRMKYATKHIETRRLYQNMPVFDI